MHAKVKIRPITMLELDSDLINRLRKEAARLDMTVPQLATELLQTICNDRLTKAVLDR
jgi:hypothetical protein